MYIISYSKKNTYVYLKNNMYVYNSFLNIIRFFYIYELFMKF